MLGMLLVTPGMHSVRDIAKGVIRGRYTFPKENLENKGNTFKGYGGGPEGLYSSALSALATRPVGMPVMFPASPG